MGSNLGARTQPDQTTGIIIRIEGDGNCLFRAVVEVYKHLDKHLELSLELMDHFSDHVKLRKKVIEEFSTKSLEIIQNIKSTIIDEEGRLIDDISEQDVDNYICKMSKLTIHGGTPEIIAIATLLKKRIIIHQGETQIQIPPGQDYDQWPIAIELVHEAANAKSGVKSEGENHYNLVVDTELAEVILLVHNEAKKEVGSEAAQSSTTNNQNLTTHKKISKKDSEWKLEIHQLDIGQGDSALILFKKLNKKTEKHEVQKSILIDGGFGFNADYLQTFISDKIGNKSLDMVMITHFDADHYFGIFQNMFMATTVGGGKKIDVIIRGKDSRLFSKNTKYLIPTLEGSNSDATTNNGNKIITALGKFYGQKNNDGKFINIFYSYRFLGKNVWDVFGEAVPDNAPNLKFIATENTFAPHDSLKKIYGNENERSTVSLIGMGNFRFYTSGDHGKGGDLIRHLDSKPNKQDYFPIQVFLAPHHGSGENFPTNQSFIDKIKARTSLISVGNSGGNYNHPNQRTINILKESDVTFVYLTNPILAGIVQPENTHKFIFAGGAGITQSSNTGKKLRGTIRVQTYQNIAEDGKEKFMVKYRNTGSKTRDYFKDKDFEILREELISIIAVDDATKQKLVQGEKAKLFLCEDDLEWFLDRGDQTGHNKKIKHLNPTTIRDFFDNYEQSEEGEYNLSILIKDGVISFEISHSKLFYPNVSLARKTKPFEFSKDATQLFNRVKDLGISLGGRKYPGIYLSEDEMKSFVGGSALTSLVEEKEEDEMENGDLFLEIVDPKGNREISTRIWERKDTPLLKKEYHKDVRQNSKAELTEITAVKPSTIDNPQESVLPKTSFFKVVARRVEYGAKEDRTPF